jgi:23S rRNA (guanosine2251-2'-O)-methyltransferase
MITVYGRNAVLEALEDPTLVLFRLHCASSNQSSDIIHKIEALAQSRGVEKVTHTKQALSRISKNGRQDQGVALDVVTPGHETLENHLLKLPVDDSAPEEWLLVDGITNPQNLGMMIRSVAASPMSGIIIPSKGNASIDALVIKASAGSLFRARILRATSIEEAIRMLKARQYQLIGLAGEAVQTLSQISVHSRRVFVVGSETYGLSNHTKQQADQLCRIPMANGVESLNAAVTASLVAFRALLRDA